VAGGTWTIRIAGITLLRHGCKIMHASTATNIPGVRGVCGLRGLSGQKEEGG